MIPPNSGFDASPTRRILWIAAKSDLAETLVPLLAEHAVDVDLQIVDGDLATTMGALLGATSASDLVVCDCSGDRGYERAFFACRAAGVRSVLLLAVGDEVDERVAGTLMAGMLKALAAARVGMVSDRVPEIERPTGGASAMPWQAEDLARLLLSILDTPTFRAGSTFRLQPGSQDC